MILNDIEVITEHSNIIIIIIIIIIIDSPEILRHNYYYTAYIYYRLHVSTFGKSQELNPAKRNLCGGKTPDFL